MTVSFENIPSDILTPGHFVEIDSTGATEGSGVRPHTALLYGYRQSTGTVAENIPKLITRGATADGYWGLDSQIAEMATAWLNVNERTRLYCIGVDAASGTPAVGAINFTGSTATAAGVANCYIGGTRYQVSIASGASATVIGAALAAAVTADSKARVTAVNTTGNVAITYKHDGPEGNDLDLRVSYRATDALPAGVTVAIVDMASGATSPDLADTITALAGTQYDTIVGGIYDATNAQLVVDELDDRWLPMIAIDGHLFTGICDNNGNTISYLANYNSEQRTIVCAQESPTPPWIAACDVGANDAAATTDDPARPRTTLRCKNVLAPAPDAVWTQNERNLVLLAGGATLKADPGGNVIIERLTTSRTKNAQGVDDVAWRDLSTKRTWSFLRWDWDTRITLKFPRHKLADDGTNFDAGQAVVTPSTIRAEAIAWFSEKENDGLVENLAQFREDLIVERNTTDFNRLDAILRPDTINKFVVSATKLQPRL